MAADSDSNRPAIVEAHGVAVLPTPPRVDLKSIDDVRIEAARVYRDMRSGTGIDPAMGTRLAYVLGLIGKLIESGDIRKAPGGRGRGPSEPAEQAMKDLSKHYEQLDRRRAVPALDRGHGPQG